MVAEGRRATDPAPAPADSATRPDTDIGADADTDTDSDSDADSGEDGTDVDTDVDTGEDARDAEATPRGVESHDARGASGWERIDGYACVALFLLALGLVALHVRSYPTLSPIDELQHVDYVIRAGDLDIPRAGERIGQEAMSEAACRLIDTPEYLPPPCGLDVYDPEAFPERGFNTSATQLPPYYSVTGIASRLLTAATPIDSQVTAARLVGGLWLGGALTLIWYLMSMFAVPRPTRAVLSGLLAATPLVLFHSSTVNADALLLLTGAIALLTTVKFEQGRLAWWWLLAIWVGLILVEPTNLLATGLGAVYLAVRLTPRSDESAVRRVVPLVALVSVVVTRIELAERLREALYPGIPKPPGGSARPSNVARAVDEVSLDRILSQLPSVFTPIGNTYRPPELRTAFTANLVQSSNWLLIGLVFAAAFVFVSQRRSALLAGLSLAAMLAAGPLYTWYYAYFSNVDFPAPGRFGLPLLPVAIVAAATAVRTRAAFVLTTAIAALVVANTVVLLA